MTRTFALLVSFLLSACVSDLGAPGLDQPGDAPATDDRDGPRSEPQASPEECNHYDDDLDGQVDDGCPCDEGQTQWCWLGAPGVEGEGTCAAGVQVCDVSQVEFPEWGPCEGAVLPAEDVCDDGEDQDCDGLDRACRAPDGTDDEPDVGDPQDAQNPDDGDPQDDPDPDVGRDENPCVASGAEECGNGIDEDCDGADAVCEVVEVDLFIFGDCVTARCPADAPYPVGCNVIFSPGDDRGCVASQPDDSTVYFQAGDECDAGLVMGTLLCSPTEGDPLDDDNCPINKPVPIYADDRNGCPETH